MSNRLTFSLASLVLIFAMLVVPTAVMAETGGPTITKIELDPDTTTQVRSGLVLKITFSETIQTSTFTGGSGGDTFAINLKDAVGDFLNVASTSQDIADGGVASVPAGARISKVFKVTLDSLSAVSNINQAREIVLQFPKDRVTGATINDLNTVVPGKTNQDSSVVTFSLPTAVTATATTVAITVAQKKDENDDPIADRYTVKFEFKSGDNAATPSPAPYRTDIVVTPADAATPVDSNGKALTGTALKAAIPEIGGEPNIAGDYAQDYEISGGLTGVQFGLHAGYIAGAAPSTPVSTPDFGKGAIADIVLWKDKAFNSYEDMDAYLPLAHDVFDTTIKYSFDPALPEGLTARAVDAQSRFIVGTATETVDPATTYKYVATNDTGGKATVSFKITVMDPKKPDTPEGLTAMEEGAMADNTLRTVNTNRVVVDWEEPDDDGITTSHKSDIEYGTPLTKYIVHWTEVDKEGEPVPGGVSGSHEVLPENKVLKTTYTIPPLKIGLYEIVVQAGNKVGNSPAPDAAKNAPTPVTVLVADPPGEPTDLRAAKGVAAASVNLDWRLPTVDGGAPITSHIIYHTAPGSSVAEKISADADRFHTVTELTASGRHVFRVAAVNSDGIGAISDGTAFEVDVPSTADNQGPTFGDATIAAIMATKDMPITGVTLPAATDPDGDDSAITYTLSPDLPAGLAFTASTRFLSGTPTAAKTRTTYTYTATDDGGDNAKTAALSFELEVKTTAPPAMSDDLPATHADGVTTITSGMIAGDGFASIGHESLPDLQEFLEIGGTIGLSNGDATDDKNLRSVVISEILWGLDMGATADQQTQFQFIELYNTTGSDIDLTGWTLTFTEGRPVPASDIDQVSNRSGVGWIADIGQSGNATGTSDLTKIVSMYRDIDYAKVTKTHDANNATENRKKQLDGFPSGNDKGKWKASTRRSTYNRWVYDSKRDKHFKGTKVLTASSVAGKPFIINEIGNDTGSDNDWVELRNLEDSEQTLKNYQLTVVTAKGTDTELFDFKDQDWKVPANGYVVISTRHPRDTDLAAGKDISVAAADQVNAGASHSFVVKSVNLPDDGKFTLILRNAHDKQGSKDNLIDVVATRAGAFADPDIGSSLWPLEAIGLPHVNVIDGTDDEDFRSPRVYQRNSGDGRGEKQLSLRGYTGVGYDRAAAATAANGGTPGYENTAVKEKIADLSNATVTISEIMLDPGQGRRNLPQWIELYNSSMVQAVNTNGWKLHIENKADGVADDISLDAVLTLDSMTIAPNQTILIVTNTGSTSDPDHFPSNRVVNLWTTKKHREALGMKSRTDQPFSTTGIYLEVTDKDNKTVDEIGNIDGSRRTRDETPAWDIKKSGDEDRRSSLIRVAGTEEEGMTEDAWVLAEATGFADAITATYYGDEDDFGTPGYHGGGPLPVSLSKFRPERLKDTGEIVIRWVTESELNNAGFNILRSETRTGEFTKINTSLIKGHGTTSERNTYEWKDTSAKPNVVYYYQIQDVSLDGKVQTLRQSRLKGNVTAAGKLTTTWGELKALQ